MMNRRGFIRGILGLLAAGLAGPSALVGASIEDDSQITLIDGNGRIQRMPARVAGVQDGVVTLAFTGPIEATPGRNWMSISSNDVRFRSRAKTSLRSASESQLPVRVGGQEYHIPFYEVGP